MNAIQTRARIDFYNDLTRSARFTFAEYNMAVNDVINEFMDQMIGDFNNRLPTNFQWIQQVRDNLYNLIKETSPSITNGSLVVNRYYSSIPSHISFPVDYYDFLLLMNTIDGYTDYSIPTSYGEIGPLLKDSFKHPTNERTYYNEDKNGLTIWRGDSGNITTSTLTYIKIPNSFSIGSEANLIGLGITLSLAVNYYATEISVYNGTTYGIGDTIVGTGMTLTSGQVILVSNTTPIDLPEKVHDKICKLASTKMLATIQMVEQSLVIEKEANKPS